MQPEANPQPKGIRPIDIILPALPWFIFTLLLCLLVFVYDDLKEMIWTLVILCGVLSLLVVANGLASNKPQHLALGIFCLAAEAASVPTGMLVRSVFMEEWDMLDSGSTYKDVNPADPAASHADATIIEFTPGTVVDTQRTIGYVKGGVTYCVAPVSSNPASKVPQYWAVGEDCCEERSAFACDDVADKAARMGVIVDDHADIYQRAVKMAGSVYGLQTPTGQPLLLRWTSDAGAYKDDLRTNAIIVVLAGIFLHLMASILAAVLLTRSIKKKQNMMK